MLFILWPLSTVILFIFYTLSICSWLEVSSQLTTAKLLSEARLLSQSMVRIHGHNTGILLPPTCPSSPANPVNGLREPDALPVAWVIQRVWDMPSGVPPLYVALFGVFHADLS